MISPVPPLSRPRTVRHPVSRHPVSRRLVFPFPNRRSPFSRFPFPDLQFAGFRLPLSRSPFRHRTTFLLLLPTLRLSMSQGIMMDVLDAEFAQLYREGRVWWNRPREPWSPPVESDPLPLSLLLKQDFQELFGGLARGCERRYQIMRRKGHYWLEKRERELWRTYLDKTAEFVNTHDISERHDELDAWFRAESALHT